MIVYLIFFSKFKIRPNFKVERKTVLSTRPPKIRTGSIFTVNEIANPVSRAPQKATEEKKGVNEPGQTKLVGRKISKLQLRSWAGTETYEHDGRRAWVIPGSWSENKYQAVELFFLYRCLTCIRFTWRKKRQWRAVTQPQWKGSMWIKKQQQSVTNLFHFLLVSLFFLLPIKKRERWLPRIVMHASDNDRAASGPSCRTHTIYA